MDFEQLRIFIVLIEEGTFLGAAKRLDTSRSRVRRKLDQLERATGTMLLSREAGTFVLTPAGEVLARRARALLAEAEILISRVREVGNDPTGRLTIALPLGPPPVGCVSVCALLPTRYPDLSIEIFSAPRPSRLLPERAEVGWTYEANVERGLEVVELSEIPMRLFAGEEYLRRHGRPETVDDLALTRLACWQHGDESRTTLPLSAGRSLKVTPRVLSEDPTFLQRLALESDFIVYAPDLPGLRDACVSTLLVEEVRGVVRERLVIPEVVADLPRVQAFIELCQATKATDLPIASG